MRKNKLLLLLALLLTAATGAWATTPNSIVINGTPQVGDKSISLTYHFDPNNVSGITGYAPTLKVKCAADNKWDEIPLSLTEVSSGTTSISLSTLGEFEAGKTYEVCFAYYNGNWVDDVFQTFVPAAAGYTVSMKDGVKDADKWTVKVGEGEAQALPIGGLKGDGSETVTLQYTGRLKVKGVKATSDAAPAAKTPATVTTALVSGGAAEGGSLMYKVTTENTKPASTDGFSDAVPTAQTITASGTVYVWYYVKGDDTHADSEIAAKAIEVPVADIVWDATNVSDLMLHGNNEYKVSYEKEGVTLSVNAEMVDVMCHANGDPTYDGISFNKHNPGGYTFTAPTGKAFTKIEMKPRGPFGWDFANLGTGWTFNQYFNEETEEPIFTVTWTGSAASTVDLLKDADEFGGAENIPYIAFYLSK